MRVRAIFIVLLLLTALSSASEDQKIPFKNLESWIKSNSQSQTLRRSSIIEKKAFLVHAIERKELREGVTRNNLGNANFEKARSLSSELRAETGGVVKSTLEKDQVHYYYYKTNDAASVKATLAWEERNSANLNLRVVGSYGAVRPWTQSAEGSLTRNKKETGATVERVDTEIKKSEEILIKVSAPKGLEKSEDYVLLVSGCEFSERQKNSDRFLETLKTLDDAKLERVKDYIRETGAALDSILPDGKTWHMVDVVDGKPKYISTFNLNTAKSAAVDKIWPGGGAGLSLNGSGLERSLGIWDEGAVRTTHQEVTGRVTIGDGCSPKEHSSHVGGTMIGTGVQATAKGMAYKASLKSFDWNSDNSEMGSEARNGLIVSQHSYGMPGDYTYSRTWDQLANQYPMYTISKSAANEGKFRGVTRDGNAKNVITVGSAQDQPSGWQGPSSNSAKLSSFSSKGPAPDGRIKPDILANGQDVYSMIHTGDTQYKSMSGTSMAGPSHAGAISLLQEHYYNLNNETYMDAATLKALVIHSADEIDAEGPDFSSGWGYINMETGAEIITADDGGKMELIQVQTLENGSTFDLSTVHENGKDVIVTIVWNDPAPASNSGDALVNDLDLRVFVDGTEHEPWMLPWTGSNHDVKAVRGDNDLDNVEKVQISNPSGSTVDIEVSHKGSLQGGSQKFSIVMTGIITDTTPFVRVSSPKGGEEWELYSTQKIKWGSNVDSPVDIFLMDGSDIVDTIAEATTNSGLYEWFIPEDLAVGNNYKIKIVCVDISDVSGESEEPFSIIPEELISTFPFVEPFEDYQNESADVGDWIQEQDDDEMDWLVFTGVTPTGQYGVDAGTGPGTGPLGDHTTGDGQYVYIEASYNYEDNKSADLTSAKFDLRGLASPTLKYWLQMYAQDGKMGDLNVDISTDGQWTNDVKSYSGSQGEDWFTDSIDLTPFAGKRVQFRFRGTVGDSFYSDICLDDIGVSATELPEFNTISDGDAKEGVTYSQDISIAGGAVSGIDFELENAPSWLSVKSKTDEGCTVEGTPMEGDAGIETVTIKLLVGTAFRTAEFEINIAENSAPEFTSTPVLEIDAEKNYEYQITLEDSDSENELSISAGDLPQWLTLVDNGSGSATLSGMPQKSDAGDHNITLLGDDDVVSSEVEQAFTVKVIPGTGIFDDGKKDAKESGLESVPSMIISGSESATFYLASRKYTSYTVVIYDNSGNAVHSEDGFFRKVEESPNLSLCGEWSGTNSQGRSCASGIYSVYLKAIKSDGSESWYKTSIGIKE